MIGRSKQALASAKHLLVCISTVALLVTSQTAFSQSITSPPAPELCADYADPIRVKVGEVEFSIPDKYKPDLHTGLPGEAGSIQKACTCRNVKNEETGLWDIQRGYCQKKGDAPLQLTEIHIGKFYFRAQVGRASLFKKDWRPADEKFDLSAGIDVSIGGGFIDSAIKRNCRFRASVNGNNESPWHKSKKADGFYESNNIRNMPNDLLIKGRTYYYSDSKKIFNLPAVIECDKLEDSISYGVTPDGKEVGNKNIGRSCYLVAPIGKMAHLYARFHDKELEPSEWLNALEQLEEFVRSIAPAFPADNQLASCDNN